MSELVPTWDWGEVVVRPWTEWGMTSVWIVLMGALAGMACGWIGCYLLLRRMALIGDAISHSMLFGLVVAFVVFRQFGTWVMFGGALFAAVLTVALIEWIHRQTRVKVDAAICIVFTTLFAIGVTMISALEAGGPMHLDAECVLYGEIAFVPLEPPLVFLGREWGPPSVVRIGLVTAGVLLGILFFYKELLVTAFDAAFARAIGLRPAVWHYTLMTGLALVVVSVFEAVGAILAVALLIVPAMFAAQLSQRLVVRFGWVAVHAWVSALSGYHLSLWLDCSTAGAMVVAGAGLFVLAWGGTAVAAKVRRIAQPEMPSDSG